MMSVQAAIGAEVKGLGVGIVEVNGIRLEAATEALIEYAREVALRTQSDGLRGGESRRNAVRQLLRAGGYRPAGRNKPAQEYLLRTVTDQGSLPSILNAVDLINAVSLDSGLPISLVSLSRVGAHVTWRYGRPGESYTFNHAGQDLDLQGLICLCGASDDALGTPVKDSLAGKVTEQDERVIACIYAPRSEVSTAELSRWVDQLGRGFVDWCGAREFFGGLVPSEW
jgi:DNA/RNA-binding domain of Phe-tRNA-synthetase-like protein